MYFEMFNLIKGKMNVNNLNDNFGKGNKF